MEIKKDIIKSIGKDKLLIMAVAGIVLIMCSYMDFSDKDSKESVEKSKVISETKVDDYVATMETRLQDLVRNVEGVGECKVMITVKGTREKVLQSDTNTKSKNQAGENQLNESDISRNTLVLKGEDEEKPYIVKEIMPEVEGVVVVAKGAKSTKVSSDIITIVQALFNVETHKISIIEMK